MAAPSSAAEDAVRRQPLRRRSAGALLVHMPGPCQSPDPANAPMLDAPAITVPPGANAPFGRLLPRLRVRPARHAGPLPRVRSRSRGERGAGMRRKLFPLAAYTVNAISRRRVYGQRLFRIVCLAVLLVAQPVGRPGAPAATRPAAAPQPVGAIAVLYGEAEHQTVNP